MTLLESIGGMNNSALFVHDARRRKLLLLAGSGSYRPFSSPPVSRGELTAERMVLIGKAAAVIASFLGILVFEDDSVNVFSKMDEELFSVMTRHIAAAWKMHTILDSA